jgi:hypothetical protein
MFTPEERAQAIEMSDRLIDLHVRRDEACQDANWQEVDRLQKQIDEIAAERHGLLASA